MKFIRENIRKLKYKIKFLNIKNINRTYISNFSSNPKLSNLMNHYGSDKGGKNNHHNYADYYSEIFFHKRSEVKNFLEIGLGTNDVNLPSNMGKDGIPLASLKAWRDYFFNANILVQTSIRISLKMKIELKLYVDQTNPVTIDKMFKDIGVDNFDIILEDGLHEFNANICFLKIL